MLKIAETFPDESKQRYRDAVPKFRLPYWDYFRPRAKRETSFPGIKLPFGKTSFPYDFSIPQIFTMPKIMIRTPKEDKLEPYDNPLFNFAFPKGAIPDGDWKVLNNERRVSLLSIV
jgi:tyrosinase